LLRLLDLLLLDRLLLERLRAMILSPPLNLATTQHGGRDGLALVYRQQNCTGKFLPIFATRHAASPSGVPGLWCSPPRARAPLAAARARGWLSGGCQPF
jgi:hypothetical protein